MDRKRRAKGRLPGEFELIRKYFAPLAAGSPLAFRLEDDAAVVRPPAGMDVVVTKDAIVEGVHFLSSDPAERIAQKLLRVNLSDLAAKGAKPTGYLMATALPKDLAERWLKDFARGLRKDQKTFGVSLIGGDTVSTFGPLTLSVTMLGLVPRGAMRRRLGAKAGDRIFVTGTLGDALFGLRLTGFKEFSAIAANHKKFLTDRYQLPRPRVGFGMALGRLATASIDISDGLMADLDHVAKASRVGAIVQSDRLPLSPAAKAIVRQNAKEIAAIAVHGDDYEILFTVPSSRVQLVERIAARTNTRITDIGEIVPGKEARLSGLGKTHMRAPKRGFTHF